jgi:predicted dehydrogenase
MDPRQDRLEQAGREVSIKHPFTDLDAALRHAGDFAGVVVSSPPKFHVEQTLAFRSAGLPILLEKPASTDAQSCRLLYDRVGQDNAVLLGYTYRWWPPMQRLKALIGGGALGTLRHARFVMSAHLADWHPWERYQDFFMSSRDLGGGALLDESHFIDLMLWFFGMPERVYARVEHISELDIETDDLVDMVAIYPKGFRVTMHLDLFGRPHEKNIVVTGENGTAQCLFQPDMIRVGRTAEPTWQTEKFTLERNDMFLAVAREFLEMIAGRLPVLTCTLLDGVKTLAIVDACRGSHRAGAEISIVEA